MLLLFLSCVPIPYGKLAQIDLISNFPEVSLSISKQGPLSYILVVNNESSILLGGTIRINEKIIPLQKLAPYDYYVLCRLGTYGELDYQFEIIDINY